jgi:hypothetical protein
VDEHEPEVVQTGSRQDGSPAKPVMSRFRRLAEDLIIVILVMVLILMVLRLIEGSASSTLSAAGPSLLQ